MNFLWTALLFLSVLTNIGHTAPACQTKDCLKKRLLLLDNLKAPLMAEIDVSSMNKQLKQYIDGSITDDVRMSFNEMIKNASKAEQNDRYDELARKLTKLTEDHEKLRTEFENSERNRSREGTVAFHALLGGVLENLRLGQKVPFKDINIDTNGGFDGQTGIFTCPHSGIYVFATTLLAYPGKRVEIAIKKNDKWLVDGYAYTGEPESLFFGSGTTHGIVHLETSDRVWNEVVGVSGSGKMLWPRASSFMGFSISLE